MSPAGTVQQGMSNPEGYWKLQIDRFLAQVIEDSSAVPHETEKGSFGVASIKVSEACPPALKMVDFMILRGRSRAEDEDHIFELQESKVPWDKALEGRGAPNTW